MRCNSQTRIELYGIMDTGIIKKSGSDVKMDGFVTSRIALTGSENPGGGTEATFKLQQYFRVNDGTLPGSYSRVQTLSQSRGEDSKTEWTGSTDVGLKGNRGYVRPGRVSNLSSDTFTLPNLSTGMVS